MDIKILINKKKLRDSLIFSTHTAYILFVVYLCLLYFLYLNTDHLRSEIISSRDVLNQYGIWKSLLLIGLIGPLFEEYIFRHVLFKMLTRFKIILTLAFSSILWAILHFSGNLLVPIMLFFLGWILGVLRIQSGSIQSATVLHASNNIFFIFFMELME